MIQVVLVSGGVESAALVAWALERGDVVPVYVQTGLPYEKIEHRKLRDLLALLPSKVHPLRVIRIAGLPLHLPHELKEPKDVEIPLRNLVLASMGSLVAHEVGASSVLMGTLGNASFSDNHRVYLDRLENLIAEGLYRPDMKLETPFMGKRKSWILQRFSDRVPWERTFSCMSPLQEEHCGRCDKCRERHTAFLQAGIQDPTFYIHPVRPYPDAL